MRVKQYLNIVHRFTLDLISIREKEELCWYVAREVVGKLGYQDCVIYMHDEQRSMLKQVAAVGSKNPKGQDLVNVLEIPVGSGITGMVAQNKEAILLNELSQNDNYIEDIVVANSELCVPIYFEGKLYGVIDSEHVSKNHFDSHDLEIFTEIASLMGAKLAILEVVNRGIEQAKIIENIQDVVIVADQEGLIKTINKAGENITGYKQADLYQKSIKDLLVQNKYSERLYQDMSKALMSEENWSGRVRVVGKGEKVHHYDLLATQQTGTNGQYKGYIAVMRNVDLLVKSELQTKRHATIFENVNDAILMYDTHGKIIDCNHQAQAMMGLEREEMIGMTSAEFSADKEEWERGLNDTLSGLLADGKFIGEGRARHSSGAEFPIEVSMTLFHNENNIPLGTVAVIRDLSEQKKRLKELKESEERFALAVAGTNDGIWDWNILTDENYFSPRWKEILGYEELELSDLFENFIDALHPDDKPLVETAIADHLQDRVPYDLEYRVKHKKGHYIWIHAKGQAIWNDDGEAVRMAGSVSDISAMKKTQNSLRRARDDAQSANISKTQFLANMSHEIRTPLNAIIGFAEALEMGVGADDPVKRNESLRIIADAGRNMNNLISEILDFSRIEVGKVHYSPEPVVTSDSFKSILPIIRHLTETSNITFKGIKSSDKKIFVDRKRLDQILLNFISNAVKYNKPNGSLEFGCYEVPGGILRIYVKDTGIGIAKDKENILFSPFDRINHANNTSGIGLGLSICKTLAEEMGGKIGFESVVGEGSTFWVDFPYLDT